MLNEATMVPLSLLRHGDNPRKTQASEAQAAELESSIRAQGLLQALVVRPQPDTGNFMVIAGHRRLDALKAIFADGGDPPEIPCTIVSGDQEGEAALAENLIRVPMHPLDEAEAFAALVEAGMNDADIASRFGTSIRHVRARVTLGSLIDEVKALYRSGEISMDIARLFTRARDIDHQRQILEAAGNDHSHWTIRRLVEQERVNARSRYITYVGLDKYKEAGGTITEDLFAEEGDLSSIYIDDTALLGKLCQEKLKRSAARVKKRAAWVELRLDYRWSEWSEYRNCNPDDEGAGVVIAVGYDGKSDLTWMMKPDQTRAEKAGKDTGESGQAPKSLLERMSQAMQADQKLLCAQNLADQLSDQQVLDIVAWELISHGHVTAVTASAQYAPQRVQTPAGIKRREALEKKTEFVYESSDIEGFRAFMALTPAMRRRLLAERFRAAFHSFSANGLRRREEIRRTLIEGDAAIGFLGVELAGSVPPTVENLWGRITKAMAVEIAEPYVDADWLAEKKKLKKADFAAALEEEFAERADFIMPGFALPELEADDAG